MGIKPESLYSSNVKIHHWVAGLNKITDFA